MPARHLTHAAPCLNKPALHESVEHELWPVAVYVPTVLVGQRVQPVAPPAAAMEPAAHEVQLVEPALVLNFPASHVTHCVPPVLSLKVPAAQEVQELLPAAENLPAAHEAHAAPADGPN